jgi:hypothetical protein
LRVAPARCAAFTLASVGAHRPSPQGGVIVSLTGANRRHPHQYFNWTTSQAGVTLFVDDRRAAAADGMAPQGEAPCVPRSAMFAKLARQLTNRRNTAPQDRPAAPLRLLINGEVRAPKRPDRGRRTLVCRWGALPGRTTLACAWQIDVLAGFGQPLRPTRRPAAVLVADDGRSRRLPADETGP